jgi:hypothetical protein
VHDPVATKLVDSFARPGGLITGFSHMSLGLTAKRLELFKEVTDGGSIAFLVNPANELPWLLKRQERQLQFGLCGTCPSREGRSSTDGGRRPAPGPRHIMSPVAVRPSRCELVLKRVLKRSPEAGPQSTDLQAAARGYAPATQETIPDACLRKAAISQQSWFLRHIALGNPR